VAPITLPDEYWSNFSFEELQFIRRQLLSVGWHDSNREKKKQHWAQGNHGWHPKRSA
jgi:hypothetical protein